MPVKYEDRICTGCGVTRHVRVSTKQDTVCIKCAHVKVTLPKKNCIVCGNPVPYSYRNRNCCSKECRYASMIVLDIICRTCGCTFKKLASQLPPIHKTTNSRGKYCSQHCYWEALRGKRLGEFKPEA